MRKPISLILVALCLSGCGSVSDYFTKPFTNLFNSGDEESNTESPTVSDTPIVEATAKYALAMGGVAPGRDELVINDTAGALLELQSDQAIVGFLPRPDHASLTAGSGAKLIPKTPGIATVTVKVAGVMQTETYRVVIPPQSLIQILMGEARGQISKEVVVTNGAVTLTSRSATAEALAAVVRNRMKLIDAQSNPSLFAVDPVAYALGGTAGKYDAIIQAKVAAVYQFSPVDPQNSSHTAFQNAEARTFDATQYAVYDQSTLTAAQIFDGSIADSTGNAFAFRTPTADEGLCLDLAAKTKSPLLPADCGPGDDNFPTLAPVQILIHPAIIRLSTGQPAFVFYRSRKLTDPAVTTSP